MAGINLGSVESGVEIDVKKAQAEIKELVVTVEHLEESLTDLDKGSDAAATGEDKVGRSAKEASQKVKDLGDNADKTGDKLSRSADKMQQVGKGLSTYITAPIIAAGTAIAKFSIDFENSMAAVYTLTGDANRQDLADGILDISNKYGMAATTLAQAQYDAISAGVDVANSLTFVDVAARASKGGFTDAATAVDGLTSAMNAYNMAYSDAEILANKFLITQNLGKTTFGELAGSIGNVAPTASAAGMSVNELLSSIAALTAAGIKTETAITGTKAALANVIKPTSEAAEKAKELGIDFSASALKAKGWVAFLKDVEQKCGGNTDAMAQLFGSVEALNAILTLTGEKGAAVMTQSLAEMRTNTGALDDAYNTVADTAGNRLQVALNLIKNSAIEFGDAVAPIIEAVASAISGLAEKLDGLDDSQKKTIVTIGLIIAAVGPALLMASKIIKAISAIKAAMVALGASANAVLGVWGLVIGAVAGLIAVVATLAKSEKELTETEKQTKKAREELKDATDDYKESVKAAAEAQEKTLHEIDATAKIAGNYIKTLKQMEKEGVKTADQQSAYNSIVAKLQELLPDVNLKINEQTGLLEGGAAALSTQVEEWQKLIKQQTMYAALQTDIQAVTNLEVDLEVAKASLSETLAQEGIEYEQFAARMADALEKYAQIDFTGQYGVENVIKLQNRIKTDGAEAVIAEMFAENNEVIQEFSNAWGYTEQATLDYFQKFIFQNVEGYSTEYAAALSQIYGSEEILSESQDALAQKTKATEEVYRNAMSDIITSSEDGSKGIIGVGEAAEDTVETVNDFSDSIINGFERIKKAGPGLKKALSNLTPNNDSMREWLDNLATLTTMGLSPETIEYLYNQGIQSTGQLVKDLVKATAAQRESFEAEMRESRTLGTTNYIDIANDKANAAAQQARWKYLTENAEAYNAAQQLREQGTESGGAFGDGVITGVKGKEAALRQSGIDAANAVNEGFTSTLQIQSPSKVGRAGGRYYIVGVIQGAMDKLDALASTGKLAATKLAAPMSNLGATAPMRGGGIPSSVSKIINNNNRTVSTSSRTAHVEQHVSFDGHKMSAAEQRRQIKRLDRDLAGVF